MLRREFLLHLTIKMEEQPNQETEPKPNKTKRALRITFFILIISWILLLGAWLAKLITIGFS